MHRNGEIGGPDVPDWQIGFSFSQLDLWTSPVCEIASVFCTGSALVSLAYFVLTLDDCAAGDWSSSDLSCPDWTV
jgi:hypothetical protein